MNQNEMARYLIDRFDSNFNTYEQRKDAALICVDEIIKACEYNHVESYNTDWWQKVKQEIEKL